MFSSALLKLKPHHFTYTKQAAYLKDRRANLKSSEVMVNQDFAMSFESVVQEEIQSAFYNKQPCSLFESVICSRLGVVPFSGLRDLHLVC